jgi:tetratricopeptide (TPR) repeat protein
MMTIIHKIEEFLGELFPRYKASGYNEEILKEEIIQYYTYQVYQPVVEIKNGFVTINIDTQRIANEVDEYRAVVSLCEKGLYEKAKPRLEVLIKMNPTNSEYYRILGQIYSDEGEQENAIDTIIDALRWNPNNTNALTMMGNILNRHRKDIDTAIKYFNRVIELKPDDHIAINNLGANLFQDGKIEEAEKYFEKAISVSPDYPNALCALALVSEKKGETQTAFDYSLAALKNCQTMDELYKQANNILLRNAKTIIETETGQRILKSFLDQLEYEGERKIEVVEDDSIETIAKMELGENYNRDHHIIRYKPNYPAKEHLMMHELVHIKFIIDARKDSINKLFTSNQKQKTDFIKMHDGWSRKMVKNGMPLNSVDSLLENMFIGMNLQIYNAPIDLFIEDFLYRTYQELRPFQVLSLYNIVKKGIEATTLKQITDILPKDVIQCSKILNIVGALQYKDLFGIDFIKDFQADAYELRTAQKMYDEYLEYRDDRQPAEEYELVANWAKDLKLDNNFMLIDENKHLDKSTGLDDILKEIEEDPLNQKGDQTTKDRDHEKFMESQEEIGFNNAVMWYMVDALKYFKTVSPSEIREIAVEIAILGTQGIKPDGQSYRLAKIPNKVFTGYNILAYYYVSWALTDPALLSQLNLPFNAEYEMAKGLIKAD